jgi:hypothetical protein
MAPSRKLRCATTGLFLGLIGYAFWQGRIVPAERQQASLQAQLAFQLTERAAQKGLGFTHENAQLDPKVRHIEVQIAGLGAAVSAIDINRDGWCDLYATTSAFGKPNALFLNQKNGSFLDAAMSAGVANMNIPGRGASMGSVWADLDNDGDLDGLLYRYGYPALLQNTLSESGRLELREITAEAGLERWMNSNGATFLDFDRDGLLDLFITGYFREEIDLWNLKTTKIMQESFEFAKNGGRNFLFRNLGNLRFEDVSATHLPENSRWTLAAVAADLNGDGWQDLYIANDYGPEELLLNRMGERFELAQGIGLEESSKSGMSVALGDVQGTGSLAVYVTNISKTGYLFQGNNLRLNRTSSGAGFVNVAEGEVLDCGWSWGAQFGDFDNDGRPDLVVLNGFISADQDRDYWYAMTKLGGAQGDIAADASNWPEQGTRSLSGYERSRLLINESTQKRVRFRDVAPAAGLNDLYDGRAVALGDFRHVGAIDLVVANQRAPLLYYENSVDPARRWIQIELTGTRSNRDAIGASVEIQHAGGRSAAVVLAASGFCAQNERVLHFGLGSATQVDELRIRWPSGGEQVVRNLAADQRHRIEEP